MKGPGKNQALTAIIVLVVLALGWMSKPQRVLAQRVGTTAPTTASGASPPSELEARRRAGEFPRRKSPDAEARMLRRRATIELAEDFERLRIINKEKVLALSSATSLDYKELSLVTAEISNRVKRIKSNSPLALKEKKSEKQAYEADAARLGSMLPELNRLIDSFLSNPVFHMASAKDDELRAAAGHDLESIIRLSETINKIAKRLIKPSVAAA